MSVKRYYMFSSIFRFYCHNYSSEKHCKFLCIVKLLKLLLLTVFDILNQYLVSLTFVVLQVCLVMSNQWVFNKWKLGSSKEVLASCCLIFTRKRTKSTINGLGSPIFAAFSANASDISDDILIELQYILIYRTNFILDNHLAKLILIE